MTHFRAFYGSNSKHISQFTLLRATINISLDKGGHQPSVSIIGPHSRNVKSDIKHIDDAYADFPTSITGGVYVFFYKEGGGNNFNPIPGVAALISAFRYKSI